jgi:hypothetical protein
LEALPVLLDLVDPKEKMEKSSSVRTILRTIIVHRPMMLLKIIVHRPMMLLVMTNAINLLNIVILVILVILMTLVILAIPLKAHSLLFPLMHRS